MDKSNLDIDLMMESFREAMKRYPEAAGGLTFFYAASGMGLGNVSPEDVIWANSLVVGRGNRPSEIDDTLEASGLWES